jgi:hypothetical protein
MKTVLCSLAFAGLTAFSATPAATITENFTNNPYADGWQSFGNTNLFQWDAANHQLAVTWDSTQTNSYFYYPLGQTLARSDDFSLEFDLDLSDIASGVEPGKTTPMELGFGFLHQGDAMSANFERGAFGQAPNVAEFDYYADGYYVYGGVIYPSPATTTPGFISGTDSDDYAPQVLSVYDHELPTNETVHVQFSFTASNQTATLLLTANGAPLGQLPGLVLEPVNGFYDTDGFQVDMVSISSYSSYGDDYDSILAHGSVANIVVTTQMRPAQIVDSGSGFSNGVWQVAIANHADWLFTLQRTTDFVTWSDVTASAPGNGAIMTLQDTNPPPACAFYRVKASPSGS